MYPSRSAGKTREQVTIGFGFISDFVEKWREFLSHRGNSEPNSLRITFQWHSNENHFIKQDPVVQRVESAIDEMNHYPNG